MNPLLLLSTIYIALVLGEDSHSHSESGSWEWVAIFDVETDVQYTWVASQVDGSYAAECTKLLILPASNGTSSAITEASTTATTIWEAGESVSVGPQENTTLTLGTLYDLEFNSNAYASMFQIQFVTTTTQRSGSTNVGFFAIFAQHNPSEFAGTLNYLIDSTGTAVAALVMDPDPKATAQTDVGVAIGAAFCVAIASFIGVAVLVPGFAWLASLVQVLHAIDAFASGALLALILYIMIPESLAQIGVESPIETQTAAWFGTMILIGFVLPIIIDWGTALIFGGGHSHAHQHQSAKVSKKKVSNDSLTLEEIMTSEPPVPLVYPEYGGDEALSVHPTPAATPLAPSSDAEMQQPDDHSSEETSVTPPKRSAFHGFFRCCPLTGVAWSITIGDGLHNFTDGVLLGVAFKFCGPSLGWSIAGASVVHELASELSEFWLLINPDEGGLTWLQAIVLNFATSLTVVIGCLMVYYINITSFTLGLLLAFGAGLLFYIATVPIWSRLLNHEPSLGFIILMFLSFTFGAVAIGLVLLSHQHCDAEGGSHSGHSH